MERKFKKPTTIFFYLELLYRMPKIERGSPSNVNAASEALMISEFFNPQILG